MHTTVMGYTPTMPINRVIFIAHALYRIERHHPNVQAFATDDGLICVRSERCSYESDD